MVFTAWRKWLGVHQGTNSPASRRAHRRQSTCLLRIEELEDRRCPTLTISLAAGQDTGPSATDNYTSYSHPTLVGTTDDPIAGALGMFIFESTDGQNVNYLGTAAVVGSTWSYTITTPFAPNTVTQLFVGDPNTNEANVFPDVIVDTGESAPTALALAPGSDSGVVGDNVTNVTRPTITGTADKALVDATASNFNTTITLYDSDGVTVLGNGAVNRDTGAWSVSVTRALAAGAHNLTARATDLAGNVSSLSVPLTITIDTTGPAAPTGLTLDPSTDSGTVGDNLTNFSSPKIDGQAGPGNTVQLFDGTTALSPTAVADGSGHWSITPGAALSAGVHSLTATATDSSGNTSTPSGVLALTIVSSAAAPTGLKLDPSTDSGLVGDNLTNFSSPEIDGHAGAGDTVQLFDGSTALSPTAMADGSGNWSITLGAALSAGVHQLTATASDSAGNTSPPSAPLSLTIDTTPPAAPTNLALDASTDSGIVGDNLTNFTRPKIDGKAEAGSTVQLFDGGTPLLATAVANSSGNWSITLAALNDGVHNLTATATDSAGNTSSGPAALTVTIDTVSPVPPTGLTLDPGTDSGLKGDDITNVNKPKIAGTALAGSTVTLLDGSTLLGTATADGGGAWSITAGTALADGVHSLTATATDGAGNTSTPSTPLQLTIDTVAQPPANLALVPGGDPHTPTITGTAPPNSSVQLFDGGVPLGLAQANGAGAWTFTTPTLGTGAHTFSAVATDVAGNTSGPSRSLADLIQDPVAPVPVRAVSVQLGRLPRKVRRRMIQTVTLTNTGTVPVTGPLHFVFLALNSKIKVVGAGGSGNPVVVVNPGPSFGPGAQMTFSVVLFNPRLKRVSFGAQVLGDAGVLA
jgi:hypothetical protein